MSCDIWLKEDIRNIILAAEQACASATAALGSFAEDEEKPRSERDELLMAYRQGYRDALRTLALALGLSEKVALPEERPERIIVFRDRKERRSWP